MQHHSLQSSTFGDFLSDLGTERNRHKNDKTQNEKGLIYEIQNL